MSQSEFRIDCDQAITRCDELLGEVGVRVWCGGLMLCHRLDNYIKRSSSSERSTLRMDWHLFRY